MFQKSSETSGKANRFTSLMLMPVLSACFQTAGPAEHAIVGGVSAVGLGEYGDAALWVLCCELCWEPSRSTMRNWGRELAAPSWPQTCSMSTDVPPPLSYMSEQLHALQHSAHADLAGAQRGQGKAFLTACSTSTAPAQRLQRGFLDVLSKRAVRGLAWAPCDRAWQ